MDNLAGWWTFVAVLLLAAGARFLMLRRLQQLAPKTWQELREPSAPSGGLSQQLAEASYLLRAAYLGIGDSKLTMLSIAYSLFYVALWLLFLLLVADQWMH